MPWSDGLESKKEEVADDVFVVMMEPAKYHASDSIIKFVQFYNNVVTQVNLTLFAM